MNQCNYNSKEILNQKYFIEGIEKQEFQNITINIKRIYFYLKLLLLTMITLKYNLKQVLNR